MLQRSTPDSNFTSVNSGDEKGKPIGDMSGISHKGPNARLIGPIFPFPFYPASFKHPTSPQLRSPLKPEIGTGEIRGAGGAMERPSRTGVGIQYGCRGQAAAVFPRAFLDS